MQFKAKVNKPGRCAYAVCQNQAGKIYQDDQWRILACSQAHADIARAEIDKVPREDMLEAIAACQK
jgi:hypothetical protein